MMLILLLLQQLLADNWRTDIDPTGCPGCRQYYKLGAYFSSVVTYQNSIVVGGRNALYELDFNGFQDQIFEDTIIETDDYEYCIREAGQSSLDCQNYYTLIMKISDNNLFVCGTSAFSPSCDTRTKADLSYKSRVAEAKVNYISSNPHATLDYMRLTDLNYTAYVGTEKGSNTGDFVIARVNMMPGSYAMKASTSSETNHWLNSPKFIYSFETEEFVYFVFQENAVEISPERVYSRIARICKDDTGDTSPFFNRKFLTFSKVRLQCSYSQQGHAPYQFDRISGAYYQDGYLYTVFSGSNTIIEGGSVFCLFKMENILEAFRGKYMFYNPASGWQDTMPSGAPFKCGGDANWVASQAQQYQMLAEVVKSEQIIHFSKEHLLQSLDVHTTMINDKTYNILHSGSKSGATIRIGFHINKFGELQNVRSVVLRTGKGEVKKIVQDGSGDVYILSNNWITFLPLQADCSLHTTCQACQKAFPRCGWCVSSTFRSTCTTSSQCSGRWESAFETCAALPEFKITPQNMTVNHKSRVVIDCQSTSGEATYWINETGTMSGSVQTPVNGSLVIESATQSDNGCYVCELRSVSGVVSARACLKVLIAPFFYKSHYQGYVIELDVSVGKDVTLPCRAGGSPSPTIVWRKMEGSNLPEGAYTSLDGDLKIIRAISEDSGQYQCNAKNSVGQNWSNPVILKVVSYPDPGFGAMEKDETNKSMISLVSTVCGILVVIVLVIVFAHYYCKRRSEKKFEQLAQHELPPGYSTYLDPRLTPIGSLRDNSLSSADAFRQGYSETNTPRWLPPHTIMSAPLSGENLPPPPYQQYFMERALLNAMAQNSGMYENVTLPRGYMPNNQQPPSPTEQIPISFTELLPPQHNSPSSAGYYVPFNPAPVSATVTTQISNPHNSQVMTQNSHNPAPIYSSAASHNMRNPLLTNNRPILSNPLLHQDSSLDTRDFRPAGHTPPVRSTTLERRSSGSLPSHVYDEIVVPTTEQVTTRPPVPPRPSRTPYRSPPDIPIIETEEG